MIVTETFYIGGTQFTRSYSDKGMKIHGGVPEADYDEACEPTDYGRTYTETNIPVDGNDAEEILGILLGGAE